MEESYGKGLASHPGPESCVGTGNSAGEALTGAHAGQVLSCEINLLGASTLLTEAEGHTTRTALARFPWAPRSRRP
jgi:RNA-directed DNA polymerase